jgi:hypothetical protein
MAQTQKLNGLLFITNMTRTWPTISLLLSRKSKALLESNFGMSLNTFRSQMINNLETMGSNSKAKATTTLSSFIASKTASLAENLKMLQLFLFLSHTLKISHESRNALILLDLLLNLCLNRKCNKAFHN